MQPLPHTYTVTASAQTDGQITVTPEGQQPLASNAPVQFNGPGDAWSPEDLFVASVADCFILTFRAVAKHAGLPWSAIQCDAAGELDKVDGVMQFSKIVLTATLRVSADADATQADQLLHKAEQHCLVSNSLKCPVTLQVQVITS